MNRPWLAALGVLLLPVVVSLAGAWVLTKASSRDLPKVRPQEPAGTELEPLNRRWLGYDRLDVQEYWGALEKKGALAAEQRFLELDLIYPFVYGAAFLASLLLAWAMLDRRFHPALVVLPVAVSVLADWTENLVLLGQLRSFRQHAAAIDSWSIQIASAATIVKLVSLAGSFLLLAGLLGARLAQRAT